MRTSVSGRRARLNRLMDENPAMECSFEEIMDLTGSAGDAVGSVDEAQDRIIEISRDFNAQLVNEWRRLRSGGCRPRSGRIGRCAGKKTLAAHCLRGDRH